MKSLGQLFTKLFAFKPNAFKPNREGGVRTEKELASLGKSQKILEKHISI